VGEIGVTARAETDDALARLVDEIETIANEEASRDALGIEITHHERFPACVNEASTVEAIRATAKSLKMKTVELERAIAFSEDFAHTINAYSGALFTLGSGEKQPPLHNVEYDFPDELIEPGARILYETAKRLSEEVSGGG
jgi:metal-dependent amidase/aminoacylase/carboxypeptidase family protein